MPKKVVYKVRTTEAVAREMARYECNEIASQENPHVPEWVIGEPDLEEAYTTYLFTVAGKYGPNVERWKSFGVGAIEIEIVL